MFETFGEGIIGHATQIRILKAALARPVTGYLFVGPAHVGKRRIAEEFVAALLGVQGVELPKAHPDILILETEEGKRNISVEQVRKMRIELAQRPVVAKRRVLHVPQADRLQEEGMNALLKILEDPPANAVFVFIAEQSSRFPATILSRLVRIPFQRVSFFDIEAGLRARGMDVAEAGKRARGSRGCPGFALELPAASPWPTLEEFCASSVGRRLELVDRLAKACDSAEDSANAWSAALDEWEEASRDVWKTRPEEMLILAHGMILARRMVGGALPPRLALESVAIKMQQFTSTRHSAILSALLPQHLSSSIPSLLR